MGEGRERGGLQVASCSQVTKMRLDEGRQTLLCAMSTRGGGESRLASGVSLTRPEVPAVVLGSAVD